MASKGDGIDKLIEEVLRAIDQVLKADDALLNEFVRPTCLMHAMLIDRQDEARQALSDITKILGATDGK